MNTLKITITLLLLVLGNSVSAQSTDYYKYKITSVKKGKTTDAGFVELWNAADALYGQLTSGKTVGGLKKFDLVKKVVIVDLAPRTEYIIEELDSLYRVNCKLVEAGSESVNGHMCRKYKAEVILSAASGIYGMQTSQFNYSYVLWITDELTGTDMVNQYISSCLTTNLLRIESKGVIVKMEVASDYGDGIYTLVETGKKEKDTKLPWLASDRAVALVPETNNYTREKYADYFKRMRALQEQITGIEKPKFASRPLMLNLL
jgi:hypothetical protein